MSWHWSVIQNLKENWLMGWKMTQRIWLIFMRAVESVEICTLMGSFYANYTKLQRFEKKLTLGSKNDMRNLVNFNVRKLHVDVLLLWEVYYIRAKKSTEELCVVTLKSDAKFEEELTVCFEKWHEEFGDFWPNTRESQNLHFNRDPFD